MADQNFFDRFDVSPDADLTQPIGGMDKPRTRAELERARPLPVTPASPAGGNYFDRFEGAGATPAPAPSSVWDRLPSMSEVGHQMALGVGHVVDAPGAALGFFANPLNTVLNATGIPERLTGAPLDTHVGEGWSEKLGLPQPSNALERVVKDTAVSGGAGLFTAGGAEAGLLATKAPGIARSFLQFLAEAPVVNTVAGAASGAASGGAREAGAPEWLQMLAGLGGGLAGGVAAHGVGSARGRGPVRATDAELLDGALEGEVLPGLPTTAGRRPEFWGGAPEPVIIDHAAIGAPETLALPAPPPRLVGPDPRLAAPPSGLADLRGEIAPPANSNRPLPEGQPNGALTPDVIAGEPDRAAMARIAGVVEQLRGTVDPITLSPRADLLTSAAPPRAAATSVWDRIRSPAPANDLDLPAVPDRPFVSDLPAAPPLPAAGIGSRARMVDITRATESNGRRYGSDGKLLTSSAGAQGEMQVMPNTNRDPGYGVTPARNNSPDELARVGRDYLAALTDHYGGDPAKGWAAYNGGPGRLDRAMRYGDDWLAHMPPETRAYVDKNMAALGGDRPVPGAPSSAVPEATMLADTAPRARDVAVPEAAPDTTLARAIDDMQPEPVARPTELPGNSGELPVAREPAIAREGDPVQVPARAADTPPAPISDPRNGSGSADARQQDLANARPVGGGEILPDAANARAPARVPAPRAPEDALTFLARNGGLRNDEGHALRDRSRGTVGGGRDLPQFAPGGGHIFRKSGMSIDQAGEALHEAGFFPHGRPTTSDVLELIDRSVNERQYRPADMPEVEQQRAARENDGWMAKTHDDLHSVASQYGDTVSHTELASMRRLIGDGRTADEAYIEHHERVAADRAATAHQATSDDDFDIPGFEDQRTDVAGSPPTTDRQAAGADRGPEGSGAAEARSPSEPGEAAADRGGPAQADAFGERRGDQRQALERRADGRSRSDLSQKPPGSDGGLFDDTSARQPDLLDAPAAPMTPRQRAQAIREGRLGPNGESGFITPDMLLAPFRAVGKLLFDPEFRNVDAQKLIGAIAHGMKNPKAVMTGTADRLRAFGEATAYSTDSALRSMGDRFNAPTLSKLADLFHAEAGVTGKTTTRTFGEAVSGNQGRFLSTLNKALETFHADDAALGRIRDLLSNPTRNMRATASERSAAGTIRNLLNDVLEYRRDAGEAIGEVKDGYFPRQMRQDKVFADPAAFLRGAEAAYRDIGAPDPAKAAQAYLQRNMDGHLGISDGVGAGSPGGNSTKAREFGKAADDHLRAFYDTNPLSALTSHISGAVKRAEESRRFGALGRENSPERLAWVRQHGDQTQWDVMRRQIQDEFRANGQRSPDVLDRIEALRSNSLGKARMGSPKVGAAVSVIHAWNQLSTLGRAAIASLPEISMGFVRGGPRYGFGHMSATFSEFARNVRKLPPSDAARYAEAAGAIGADNSLHLLRARADDPTANTGTSKLLDQFYRKNGLEAWTRAGRTAAVKTAQKFVDVLAHDIESTNARVSNRAAGYLRELGVSDPKSFAATIRSNTPSAADLLGDTGHAAEYSTALLRFANQSILMPTRSVKPSWASHPIGSLVFALQSYNYAFKKNVLDRVGREGMAAIKERDPAKLAAASGLVVLTGTTALVQGLRHTIYGSPVNSDEQTPMDYALETMDRSGLFGAASPVMNAFKGLKYQRSVGQSLQGSVLGRTSDGLDAIGGLVTNNNEDTDAAERKAAAAFYDLAVKPTEAAIGAGVLRGAAGSAMILGTGVRNDDGLLPADRAAFVDTFGGENPKDEGE